MASVVTPAVAAIDPDSGQVVEIWNEADGARSPDDIAFGPDGSAYWTDISHGLVTRHSPDGTHSVVADLGPGVNPITFSDDGRLFVSQCFMDDKLYEVDAAMNLTIRPESVGGTHACRMIHRESNQLIIGPYFIDAQRNVRSADLKILRGRMTAVMRHLTDPAIMVYFFDMEGAIYEVNVHTLAVKKIFSKPPAMGIEDGCQQLTFSDSSRPLPVFK